jgi:hypothetical protein
LIIGAYNTKRNGESAFGMMVHALRNADWIGDWDLLPIETAKVPVIKLTPKRGII